MNPRQVILLFVVSFAVRLGYQILVLYWDGSFLVADSMEYIRLARGVMETGELAVLRDGVVVPHMERMPLYPYFLAGAFSLAGSENIALAMGLQGAIGGSAVIGVGLMARAIDERWAWPTAGLACVWPNLVVHTSLVLTDTLYVTLLTFALCACLWAARGRGTIALLSLGGLCFGFALMTRPVLMYYPAVLFSGARLFASLPSCQRVASCGWPRSDSRVADRTVRCPENAEILSALRATGAQRAVGRPRSLLDVSLPVHAVELRRSGGAQ